MDIAGLLQECDNLIWIEYYERYLQADGFGGWEVREYKGADESSLIMKTFDEEASVKELLKG